MFFTKSDKIFRPFPGTPHGRNFVCTTFFFVKIFSLYVSTDLFYLWFSTKPCILQNMVQSQNMKMTKVMPKIYNKIALRDICGLFWQSSRFRLKFNLNLASIRIISHVHYGLYVILFLWRFLTQLDFCLLKNYFFIVRPTKITRYLNRSFC